MPPDPPNQRPRSIRAALEELDLPGVALFVVAISGLLGFLLSVDADPAWWLIAVAAAAAVLLVRRERSEKKPFLDVRFLAANRRLVSVYAEFAAMSLVFYSAFFGLPLWLQQTRQLDAALVGLVVLPITGVGVLLTPVGALIISRCISTLRPSGWVPPAASS